MGAGRSDPLLLAKDELGALSPNRGVKSGVPGGVREVESVDLRPESGRRCQERRDSRGKLALSYLWGLTILGGR